VERYLSRNSRLEGQYGSEEEVDPLDLDGTCSPPAPAAAGTAPKATSYPCYSFSRRRRLGFTRLRREIWLRRTQRPQRWRKPSAALRSCCEYSVTQVFFLVYRAFVSGCNVLFGLCTPHKSHPISAGRPRGDYFTL
jgi:hypothetical protein